MMFLALQLMLYGLGGVFFALAVLYAANLLIVKLFPEKPVNKDSDI